MEHETKYKPLAPNYLVQAKAAEEFAAAQLEALKHEGYAETFPGCWEKRDATGKVLASFLIG